MLLESGYFWVVVDGDVRPGSGRRLVKAFNGKDAEEDARGLADRLNGKKEVTGGE